MNAWREAFRSKKCREPDPDDLGTLIQVDPKLVESLQILGRLHTIETERFHERRRLEWSFSFTLWIAIGAAGAVSLENLPRGWISRLVISALFAGIALVHFLFEIIAIAPGACEGRAEGYRMSNLSRKAIGLDAAEPLQKYRLFWSHYWMPTVTSLLVGVVVVLMMSS